MGKILAVVLVLVLAAGGCGVMGYNGLVSADETVSAKWSEVENQYKRRADLVPNLVKTVKAPPSASSRCRRAGPRPRRSSRST
jgi:LemA protein